MADEFRVGRHQPGNLYRDEVRFGFTIRDEDGPLVAAALNAYSENQDEPVRADLIANVIDDSYRDRCGQSIADQGWLNQVAATVADLVNGASVRADRPGDPGDGCRLCSGLTARLRGERDSARAEVVRLGQLADRRKGILEFVADQVGLPLDAVDEPAVMGGALLLRIKALKRATDHPLGRELDRLFPCADCAAWPWDRHAEGCSAVDRRCPPCRRDECEECMGPDHPEPGTNPWACPCNSGGSCRRFVARVPAGGDTDGQ